MPRVAAVMVDPSEEAIPSVLHRVGRGPVLGDFEFIVKPNSRPSWDTYNSLTAGRLKEVVEFFR